MANPRLQRAAKTIADIFAFRFTVSIKDVEIGYGTVAILIGLAAWLIWRSF